MATVRYFEELECWQGARKLVNLVYGVTKRKEFSMDYELKGQIRSSAISVMANIAEGFHRNSTKDFMRFLDYSRASIAETLSHSFIALDQQYIADSDMQTIRDQSMTVWMQINKFISYLNQYNQKTKSTNTTNLTNLTHPTSQTSSTNSTNITNITNKRSIP